MPELPEVETVKLQLADSILNEDIKSVRLSKLNLRKPLNCSSSKLKNRKFVGVSRWGKKLLIHFDDDSLLDVSLGMTGMMRVEEGKFSKQKHDHLIFELKTGKKLIYNDPRRFGWVSYVKDKMDLDGWDPILSPAKDYKLKVLEPGLKSKKTIYSFLMDQKYIVGLGNIYVQEVLFKARIHPFKRACDCSEKDFENIRKACRQILKQALSHGGSTILSYQNAKGEKGGFQNKLKVYGKKRGEPCRVCKAPLKHVMEARSVSFCSNCQT